MEGRRRPLPSATLELRNLYAAKKTILQADETYSSLRTQLSLDLRLIILTSSLIICSLFLFVLKRNSEKPDP